MTTPRRKRTKSAAALVAAAALGAAGGRASAPAPETDPLGGWHYADLPAYACTTIEGSGVGRVTVRPEIVTANGQRVNVVSYQREGTDQWLCAVAPVIDRSKTPAASDTCYQRLADGSVEVTVGGRVAGSLSTFPPCILEAFYTLTAANPLPQRR